MVEVRGQSQTSEVRGQRSEVRGQRSGNAIGIIGHYRARQGFRLKADLPLFSLHRERKAAKIAKAQGGQESNAPCSC